MKGKNIEGRLKKVEDSKHLKPIPHCLSFCIADKEVGYRCEVLRWDSFGGWALNPEQADKHFLGRIVKDFDDLQETVDYIDNLYSTYERTYGVPCTAQILELTFRPTEKQHDILSRMKKHLLWLGTDREI